jgi:hypothetical protein
MKEQQLQQENLRQKTRQEQAERDALELLKGISNHSLPGDSAIGTPNRKYLHIGDFLLDFDWKVKMFARLVKRIAISLPFSRSIVDSEAKCRAEIPNLVGSERILHVSGMIRGELGPGIVPAQLKVNMWVGRAMKS